MRWQRFPVPDPFAAAAFGLPLLAYGLTLSPTVFWLDSGIYLAAAKELGIAYPPGFPLYVLATHLAGHIPVGTFAQRAHAVSALFGAGACLALYFLVLRLAAALLPGPAGAADAPGKPGKGKPAAAQAPPAPVPTLGSAARAAALLAALGLGFSFSLWSQSVNSEVYSLQALITALILLFLVRIETAPVTGPRTSNLEPRTPWLFLALVSGLGFANHPMIVAVLPALAFAVWRRRAAWKAWLPAAPVFLVAGLLPYAYIPLRSRANPLTDWGDPETPGRFLSLVTATHWTAESASYSFFGAGFWERLGQASWLFALQFLPAALAAGALGAVVLFRRSRPAFLHLALVALFSLLVPLLYTQTKEFESWFLPAYVAFAAAAGAGAVEAIRRIRLAWPSRRSAPTAAFLAALALFHPGWLLALALPSVDRSRDFDAEDYAESILRGVGENGILFISGDNPSSTVLFAQAVLGSRPDVAVVNQEALQSSWYRGHVRKNLGLSVPEPDGEVADLAVLVTALVLEMLRENPSRPAYVLLPRNLRLPQEWRCSPSGMVYRLSKAEAREPPERWDFQFQTRIPLAKPRPRDQRRKVGESQAEMRAGFLRAWATGGEEFFGRGDFRTAEGLFARGLALAPEAEDLALRLGVCQVQQGRKVEARDTFAALVRRLPLSYQGHYNLGNVLSELGDDAGARAAYSRALEIEPRFELARKALADMGR